MKFLKYPAYLGLALTIVPPALYMTGSIASFETTMHLMTAGMVVWFLTATPWLALQEDEPTHDTSDQI